MKENNNDIKKAIALEYNKGLNAPKVVATGKGCVADNIIKKAHENNIPVHEDQKLANNLVELNLGDEIPQDLYEAVAQVLAFIYDVDKLTGEGMK